MNGCLIMNYPTHNYCRYVIWMVEIFKLYLIYNWEEIKITHKSLLTDCKVILYY